MLNQINRRKKVTANVSTLKQNDGLSYRRKETKSSNSGVRLSGVNTERSITLTTVSNQSFRSSLTKQINLLSTYATVPSKMYPLFYANVEEIIHRIFRLIFPRQATTIHLAGNVCFIHLMKKKKGTAPESAGDFNNSIMATITTITAISFWDDTMRSTGH